MLFHIVKTWLDRKSALIFLGQLPTGVNIFFVQFQWLLKIFQKYSANVSWQAKCKNKVVLIRWWKKLGRKAKTSSTHIVTATWSFFFVHYNYPVFQFFAGFLDIFTLKNDTCFSDSYFHHTIWVFGWFGSGKAECGHQQDEQSAAQEPEIFTTRLFPWVCHVLSRIHHNTSPGHQNRLY